MPMSVDLTRILPQLHHLGKDYPDASYNFNRKLHGCFLSAGSKAQTDEDLQKAIDKADFVKRELEALYFLKKYRQSKLQR